MPSIIGNETYNFKFEFYDVNNNYVPVFVTQSATFTGGANINTTLLYISSSASSSLSQLYAVSSSISGTMTIYSSSASSSVGTLSGSVSSSLSSLSSSVSSSNLFILSSSLSKVQQLANGQYSGSFIGDTVIYSPTIGGQQGYISSLFKVGTAPSIYLDARTSTRKIYIGGANDTGSYSSGSTFVYMDSTGKFSLKDKLTWDGDNLSVNGTINVTGGNAATDANAQLYASRAVTSGSLSATAAQTAAELFAASAAGRAVTSGSNAASAAQSAAIAQAKSDASASINLLANGDWTAGNTFISSRSISSPVIAGNAGYISSIFKVGNGGITLDGDTKKIFVGNGNYNNSDTPFYFASGSTNIFSLGNKLTFNGNALSVNGSVTATSLTATTTGNIAGWSFDSTKLTSGRIILDSATPQIFMSGSVSKVKIGTRNLVELTGADDQRTVYLGEGGIKITGDWDGTNSEYPSYITLAADSAYAKAIFFNKNVGYSSELVYMYALPYGAGSCLRIENGGARIRNYNDGSGYTGTGNGGYGLQVDSISGTTATFTGDVTANTSDGRLKTNIKNIDSPLEKISKINGVYFNWNEKAKELSEKDTTIREVGFIAQEVKEILPEIVKRAAFDTIMDESITDRVVFKSKSGDEYLTIQYEKIVPLLVEAIKELKNEIEELKKNK
jgi:hypothetical protein